jgi:poly-gamma-glutamate synthesis protein (capsule biosynthesis protein)
VADGRDDLKRSARMSPTIGLLGDIMLGRQVAEVLGHAPPEAVWAPEVRDLLGACDVVLGNLECCVSERGAATTRIADKPFFFRAPPAAIDSLRAIGAGAVGLANNHALDFETDALADTVALAHAGGIATAGAGGDAAAARRAAVIEHPKARIALVAFSDHPREFAAGEPGWGIAWAPLNRGLPSWLAEELRGARERCDLVIAFPHWGPNMTTRPGAWQRERARELLAAGAHVVAGHSAHVFHGAELLPQGPVLYDLGGALDDYAVDGELRNDLGLLALWRPGGAPELELVGLALDHCHTRLATGAGAEWIAGRLAHACGELGTPIERVSESRHVVVAGRPAE